MERFFQFSKQICFERFCWSIVTIFRNAENVNKQFLSFQIKENKKKRVKLKRLFIEVNYLEKKFRPFTQTSKYFSWNQIYIQYSFVCAQCGNYGIFLSCIFGKNFVKPTVLIKKLLKCWFDDLFFLWEWISRFSTQCFWSKDLAKWNFQKFHILFDSNINQFWRI